MNNFYKCKYLFAKRVKKGNNDYTYCNFIPDPVSFIIPYLIENLFLRPEKRVDMYYSKYFFRFQNLIIYQGHCVCMEFSVADKYVLMSYLCASFFA